jgi:CheY-like chemotaxis protein
MSFTDQTGELHDAVLSERMASSGDRFELLILGRDSSLLPLVRAAQAEIGLVGNCISVGPQCAFEVLGSSHFDGIVLDCGDVAMAFETLARIRQGRSNRHSPVIAVVNGPRADVRGFQSTGANFFVWKPVSAENIKAQLNKAFDAIQREHRRYFRYKVSLPISLGTEMDGFTSARLINLSEQGMAVLLRRSVKPEEVLSLRFDLPSIDPYHIEATGEVIWTDARGRVGIKLLSMPSEARRKYTEWLDVLRGQLEFRRLSS